MLIRFSQKITDALIKYEAHAYQQGDVSDAVIEAISLHIFFEELVLLGTNYNIGSTNKFQDKDVCFKFAFPLLLTLIGSPLMLTEKKIKANKKLNKIVEGSFNKALQNKVSPDKCIAIGLNFTIENDKIHIGDYLQKSLMIRK
ncbi:MAG: hypothetical protein RR084_08165 [Bacteroidales bacterium]